MGAGWWNFSCVEVLGVLRYWACQALDVWRFSVCGPIRYVEGLAVWGYWVC